MSRSKSTQAARSRPVIALCNRQRAVRLELEPLQRFTQRALERCLEIPKKKTSVLAELEEIAVILVSDRRMAQLHQKFLDVPGPTDVITFQHGEIFVSMETAQRHARKFGTSVGDELRLYIIHGLLHLHGFNDTKPADIAEMTRAQEKLVAKASADL